MPELPEAETIRKQLLPVLLGSRVRSLRSGPYPKIFLSDIPDLSGWQFSDLGRIGKVLLFSMKSPAGESGTLLTRLGMSGQWNISGNRQDSQLPLQPSQTTIHTHLAITLETPEGERLLSYRDPRRFGRVEWQTDIALSGILQTTGPDILKIRAEQFEHSIRASRRSIRTILLDQKIASGIGNIYVSEILFESGIHPDRKGFRITGAEARRILESSAVVLQKAIDRGGSSIHSFKDAFGEEGGNQSQLQVYGLDGSPCPLCKSPILKKEEGGRSSYFCLRCQPKKRTSPARS
ncbi:bifunctional DNA-formamidopyrimidine glycosylase/DNA-(apurinic or apyrimidinic site) lyase [Leptospirillum ferrooxidans]|uniref:Formamidopyrimidine-DNA glycosylase n=1 Tax=Leptospirillum ferrooxidans (strain C2-3) TaxID=1162668 RepID=I0IRX6_LEPFC|nr:bifunctional DNA-formamidopyrimidine glycosylase/DNA-(apurinic or apyrimidinic site) lyase [Leptospirillum ferrooxidans]BAM08025.1 putative formamidopyrimidine-DNA glycosylase [Leptospirillum ferrooxidans C2-3]